jgi:hypothetical protein
MISDQITQCVPTSMTTADIWPTLPPNSADCARRRGPAGWRVSYQAGLGVACCRMAALWEASLLVDRLEYFQPDRCAAEAQFLTDSRPRG